MTVIQLLCTKTVEVPLNATDKHTAKFLIHIWIYNFAVNAAIFFFAYTPNKK